MAPDSPDSTSASHKCGKLVDAIGPKYCHRPAGHADACGDPWEGDKRDDLVGLQAENVRLRGQLAALKREIDSPIIHDFLDGVVREAAHQRLKWGFDHDNAKAPSDWFWTVGYVLGKAMNLPEKRLHHLITAAAIMLNWHLYQTQQVPSQQRDTGASS